MNCLWEYLNKAEIKERQWYRVKLGKDLGKKAQRRGRMLKGLNILGNRSGNGCFNTVETL